MQLEMDLPFTVSRIKQVLIYQSFSVITLYFSSNSKFQDEYFGNKFSLADFSKRTNC